MFSAGVVYFERMIKWKLWSWVSLSLVGPHLDKRKKTTSVCFMVVGNHLQPTILSFFICMIIIQNHTLDKLTQTEFRSLRVTDKQLHDGSLSASRNVPRRGAPLHLPRALLQVPLPSGSVLLCSCFTQS